MVDSSVVESAVWSTDRANRLGALVSEPFPPCHALVLASQPASLCARLPRKPLTALVRCSAGRKTTRSAIEASEAVPHQGARQVRAWFGCPSRALRGVALANHRPCCSARCPAGSAAHHDRSCWAATDAARHPFSRTLSLPEPCRLEPGPNRPPTGPGFESASFPRASPVPHLEPRQPSAAAPPTDARPRPSSRFAAHVPWAWLGRPRTAASARPRPAQTKPAALEPRAFLPSCAPCALCWRAPWAAVASLGALGPGPNAPPACGAWWAAWVHPFVRIGTALFVWSCRFCAVSA